MKNLPPLESRLGLPIKYLMAFSKSHPARQPAFPSLGRALPAGRKAREKVFGLSFFLCFQNRIQDSNGIHLRMIAWNLAIYW